ncbi:MAG: LuxR C-terminal-related transcriptional regulator [Egibacteraceae bacterium]
MLARDLHDAIVWGERAVEVAEQRTAALLTVGTSRLLQGDPAGAGAIRRSIAAEEAGGRDQGVARGWVNLGSAAGEMRDYALAVEGLRSGIDHARARDLDASTHYGLAWLARVAAEQGDWDGARALLEEVPLDALGVASISTITGLTVRGLIGVRTGVPAEAAALTRARELAAEAGDLQRTWPVTAALAERAWLDGDEAPGELGDVYALAVARAHPWATGELGLWLHRTGTAVELPEVAAAPHRLHAAGRLRGAAREWASIGCPYEAASALADSDDVVDLQEALAQLDALGAAPLAARVRGRLRRHGVRGVPRGPRAATAAHPAGLTPRQSEVLALLAIGLSDAQIAARLSISPKTCGHHVSAVLSRLGAGTRTEAAHRARELGLLPN